MSGKRRVRRGQVFQKSGQSWRVTRVISDDEGMAELENAPKAAASRQGLPSPKFTILVSRERLRRAVGGRSFSSKLPKQSNRWIRL